ncbi:MAG: response regulator [Bacillota bacterium]|uniref:Stage 0 sporulation protein A homolog n=1 Tax=Thermanaerosceptrum fracticalcis TaxID=1712410 RepID=A0A7G6E413_THEFR|nr:response regulator [Thermanaerosceptrum fracticalcis]QNB46817.1 response regulator [Thermanaerosceptrum fracticalcis]
MSTEKKVLIVEDSNIVRLEVKRTLEQYGVKVLELVNAEDLFRFPKRYQEVNLIILDITLPGMDGLTALERMRSEQAWAYLPVIILTGRADRVTVQRALKAGAVNYIRKPFTKEGLLERVEGVLGPLVPPEDNREAWTEAELEEQVRNEVKRAQRGGSLLSLLEIRMPDEMRSLPHLKELVNLRNKVKEQLREIDSVFLTRKRNLLLVLPLTGAEGAAVVTEKFRKWFTEQGIQKIDLALVTFPKDGVNEQELLNNLGKKLSG